MTQEVPHISSECVVLVIAEAPFCSQVQVFSDLVVCSEMSLPCHQKLPSVCKHGKDSPGDNRLPKCWQFYHKDSCVWENHVVFKQRAWDDLDSLPTSHVNTEHALVLESR